ncbi:MAG TPA: SpoIIE family protein phosphatase [Candidatus Cloacimonadota bacterium]|mgnify:CR=1 FL=1|nr:SpoIIE family protein phosphatase [Candidatus Cloacimonadota bacterium]HPS38694.1 SpoIIE family protein phosphatase [Candidatus Cloacimonadota bacterium]
MLRRINSKSLTYQIIGFIVVIILVVMVVSIYTTRYLMSKVMMVNSKNYITSIASENINRIEGALNKTENQAINFRYLIQNNLLNQQEIDEMVSKHLLSSPEIVSCGLAYTQESSQTASSYVFCRITDRVDKLSLNPNVYLYQDWFQIPEMTSEARWSEPWFDTEGSHKLVSSYSIPVMDGTKVRGIIRLDMDLATMQNLVMPAEQKQMGYMFLISGFGTIVTHPADSLVMNYTIFSYAEANHDKQLREIGRDMIKGNTGFVRETGKGENYNHWLAYAPLKSNGWSLGVVVAHKDIFKDLNLLLLIQTLATIIGFLLMLGVVFARVIQINRPLSSLTQAAEHIGEGNFDVPLPKSNSFYELAMLTQSFESMRQSLKTYIENLRRTTEEKNRILSEVTFASTIQRNLIPKNTTENGGSDPLRIYGILEPAGDIGGDLFDYFPINENLFCFAIADVLGKGIVAAMTMTMVTTYLRAKAAYHEQPDTLLSDLNRYLCVSSTESNFVTIILGIIDLRNGSLSFSNAGHVPLFVRKADRSFTKYGETHSTALGVFPDLKIGMETIRLDLGDELILFTDGITEAMTVAESFFGIERLEQVIKDLHNPHAETTAKAILNGARKFSDTLDQYDDITILVIDFLHPKLP